MTNRAISSWSVVFIVAVAAAASFVLGAIIKSHLVETRMTEARERSMRVELCGTICRTREEGMLGITEHPAEWRCFCDTGHMQPLP